METKKERQEETNLKAVILHIYFSIKLSSVAVGQQVAVKAAPMNNLVHDNRRHMIWKKKLFCHYIYTQAHGTVFIYL